MRYKVENNNDFSVGIRFENKPGHDIVIRPNSFVMMEEEDILYVDSVSKLFSKGVIFTEDKGVLEKMGYVEKNPNTISKEEVKELLDSNNSRLKSELTKITESHAIKKITDVIKDGEVDLSQSKMKIIGDALDVDLNAVTNDEVV